jgi:hypothetical protein
MITAERGSGRPRMVRIQLRIDRLRRRGSPPRTGSASSALRGAHTRRGVIGDRELRVVLARTRARSDPHLRAQDRNGVASASGAGGAGGDQSLRYAARVIDVLRRVLRHEPDPRFGALEIERNRPTVSRWPCSTPSAAEPAIHHPSPGAWTRRPHGATSSRSANPRCRTRDRRMRRLTPRTVTAWAGPRAAPCVTPAPKPGMFRRARAPIRRETA